MNTYPQTDFQLKARTLSTSRSPAHTDLTHAQLSNQLSWQAYKGWWLWCW